jgi:predicted tellurium resistance membrane protein TerC
MNNSKIPLYISYGCLIVFVAAGLNLFFNDLTPRETEGGYLSMVSVFICGIMMLVMWLGSSEDNEKSNNG